MTFEYKTGTSPEIVINIIHESFSDDDLIRFVQEKDLPSRNNYIHSILTPNILWWGILIILFVGIVFIRKYGRKNKT